MMQQAYGDPSSAKFARAQRNFAKSLAGEYFDLLSSLMFLTWLMLQDIRS